MVFEHGDDLFSYVPLTLTELHLLVTQECRSDEQSAIFKALQIKLEAYKEELEAVENDQKSEQVIFCE